MEINNEITKDVFERNVPAAKMPERNSSVFNRLEKMFELAYSDLVSTIISPEKTGEIDNDEELKKMVIREICVDAFLRTCRSMDLVLTATGFGIVSTDSLAPASRYRVDALIEELGMERLTVIGNITRKMTSVDGWHSTAQAAMAIPTLLYHPSQLWNSAKSLTTLGWKSAMERAQNADTILRVEISDNLMDEILGQVRSAAVQSHTSRIVTLCQRFIVDYAAQDTPVPNKNHILCIVEELEANADSYPAYKQSSIYAKRHAERFENKKTDKSFFFI